MSRSMKVGLCCVLGAIFALVSAYVVLEDLLYGDPVQPLYCGTLVLGIILLILGIGTHVNGKKADAAASAEKEKRQEDLDERYRQMIAAEEAELERLENSDNIACTYRLTHCVAPAVQDAILFSYEGEKVFFAGDDDHDDVVWIMNKVEGRLGRLPKEAAALYLEKGAAGVFIKSLENEDGNTIPYVRVFWRRGA